ncbi:MAG: [FeFe] hydrogenase H-cluster maturation GTPase HydF [Treponema sp.]|nr:[FeFe] hydrogenase H-cluster maturation GTPase HydF [Treponema sp.]
MGLNDTPSASRLHIGFFGRRNTGKSSLVNAVTGQELAVVSDVKGTTTDPVYKAMELLPLGPVIIIDTPGIDDEGELGELRVSRTRRVLNKTDIAVLVLDSLDNISHRGTEVQRAQREESEKGEERIVEVALFETEEQLVNIFKEKKIPYIIVINKIDLGNDEPGTKTPCLCASVPLCDELSKIIPVSAKTGFNINLLKETIAAIAVTDEPQQRLVADLIQPLDFVVLVVPIDSAAPKGRLILPQQQVIRGILEAGAVSVVVRDCELKEALAGLGKQPALVITDSQVFAQVAAEVPPDIPLTSFSILFARYKGLLETSVRGAAALDSLRDGDAVLICEGCTHHRQCDDIGTVKIPRMIRNFTGKEPEFHFRSGGDFPEDISPYRLIIHCGACMLNDREMHYRRRCAEDQGIPFTNYGIAIARMQGILERSIAIF